MEKSTFEQMGGTYRQEGDHLFPNLTLPESTSIGIRGQRRRRYLQEHRRPLYNAMLLSDKLDNHLAEIDQQAEQIFFQLVKQLAKQEGVTGQLKGNGSRGCATCSGRCISSWGANGEGGAKINKSDILVMS